MVTGRVSRGLEERKCRCSLQEGQEGELGELQTGQPHLSPWKGNGANNSESCFQTYEGQEGDCEK